MKYYILDKQSNKAYGPLDSKREADEALEEVLNLAKQMSEAVFKENITFETTQKMDEMELKANGNLVGVYEIIPADQFDNPDKIPPEFA